MTSPFPIVTLGSPNLPPLVFLHGFLGRGADWLPIARAFADRYHCLLPDLPGHGANLALPLDTPLNYSLLAEGLSATLPDSRPVTLLGYSMGGRIALYFALRYPERVQTLILESTSPGLQSLSARTERARIDDLWAEKILLNGLPVFVDEWYRLPLFRSLQRQPALLETIKQQRRQNHPEWMAKIISELSPGRQPYLGKDLSKLFVPTLLLAGRLDEKYTAALPGFAAAIPQARALKIPFAGHTLHAERTERFIRILRAFLKPPGC